MLTLSHYRFKQFLKHKAFEAGKTVLDVNEAYTSKTISSTGEIIHNLGGRKTIKDNSGFVMDRDLNGGRGIFLRSLVDIPSLKNCIVNISEQNYIGTGKRSMKYDAQVKTAIKDVNHLTSR